MIKGSADVRESSFKSSICWREIKDEEKPEGEVRSLGAALDGAFREIAETFEVSRVTESPIETFFGAAFYRYAGDLCRRHGIKFVFGDGGEFDMRLRPQHKLGRFRFDFAMDLKGIEKPVLLIECDGKAFHSSPEQIENDRRKDDAARQAGIALIRFTGAELNRDPRGCVQRAFQAAGRSLP